MGLLQGGAFNTPENQPVFAAVRIKTQSARGTRSSPPLHFPPPAPRHTLHHTPSPTPPHAADHVLIARSKGQAVAGGRNTAEHGAHWHQRGVFGGCEDKGRQRLFPAVLFACISPCEEACSSLNELERAHDVRAYLFGRRGIAVGAEG